MSEYLLSTRNSIPPSVLISVFEEDESAFLSGMIDSFPSSDIELLDLSWKKKMNLKPITKSIWQDIYLQLFPCF